MKKLLLFFVLGWHNVTSFSQKNLSFSNADYITILKQATDVMVNDATSPVAAARYYAYITLAANETITLFDKQQPQFAGTLKEFKRLQIDDSLVSNSDPQLAVMFALNKSATRLLPSGYLLKKNLDSLKSVAKKRKLPVQKINATLNLADKVVDHILIYASTDGFSKLSGLKKYTPLNGDEYWQPTAPGFMAAIEPNWATLRTFFLDSCSQFTGGPPHPYSTDVNSSFYKEMKEVYDYGTKATKEQSDIANFWDCNPFALQQVGHLEFGLKKISPGGHWIGITGIACKKKKLNLFQTAYAHTMVSIGLADAFISCWENKYKFNRIRPETAIKRLIDQNWAPLLQTPPFPEYTSGHSVASTVSSIILTHLFGDHFSFTDDIEVEFGLPARKFISFIQASKEAALSRLYGGIHYRDAIVNGMKEGEQIGKFIVANDPGKMGFLNSVKK